MSQTYVIRIATSVRVPVPDQADRIVRELALGPIMDVTQDELDAILTEVVARDPNWQRVEDGVFERERGGVKERLDVRRRRLEATVTTDEGTVEVEGLATVGEHVSDEALAAVREVRAARLREQAERELIDSEAAVRAARRELAARLEATEPGRRGELNRIVRDATAELLKRRASRLGEVTSVREGGEGEQYELVITIRSDD